MLRAVVERNCRARVLRTTTLSKRQKLQIAETPQIMNEALLTTDYASGVMEKERDNHLVNLCSLRRTSGLSRSDGPSGGSTLLSTKTSAIIKQ